MIGREDPNLQERIREELNLGYPMTELQLAERLNESVRDIGIQLDRMRLYGSASMDKETRLWTGRIQGVAMRAPSDQPLQVSIMLALEESMAGLEACELAGLFKMPVGPIVAQLWHLQNTGYNGRRACFDVDTKRYHIINSRP